MEGLKADVVDWDQLERTTDALLDTKKISNLKAKINKETNPAGHSFEAVANLKLKSDEKDEYFIYKMNDRRMNPDEPSYVFKTSKLKINMALSMGDKEHFMANEYCYIDGKWNRCKDFPTVTLSVYHPVLRKQVPLFIMECEGETAESYAKFFQLVNGSIAKVAPGRVFDPVAGFMADEAGGLQEGLRRIFGNSVLEKLKTCKFHFLQCANRQRARLHSEKSKEFFTRATRTLLHAQTSSAYNDAIVELKEFVAKKPAKDQQGFLIPWLQWWDDRRAHVFPAFARKNAPATNLAEVIHSKWKTTGETHLSLVDAAAEDIKDSLLLERQYRGYEAGTFHGGKGPGVSTMASRSFRAQNDRAKMYIRDLIENEEPSHLSSRTDAFCTYEVDPQSSHRATEPKKNAKKTSNVRQQEDNHSLASTSSEEEIPQEPLTCNVEPGNSLSKRRARRRTRSRQFNNTFKRATQTDRHRIKLLSVVEEGELDRKYQVTSARDWLGYGPYSVSIGRTPSCTCNDFLKGRVVKICKHLIWVYVVVLGVDEKSDVLQQAALTEQEVQENFQNAPPPPPTQAQSIAKPASSKNSSLSATQTYSSNASTAGNMDRIIRKDPRSKEQLVWRLERFERKAGPKPHCAGCKKVSFDTGDIVLEVDALYVPRDREFCVQRTYRFCVDAQCFSNLPKFCNLTPVTNAVAGRGVSQQDIQNAFSMGLTIQ